MQVEPKVDGNSRHVAAVKCTSSGLYILKYFASTRGQKSRFQMFDALLNPWADSAFALAVACATFGPHGFKSASSIWILVF